MKIKKEVMLSKTVPSRIKLLNQTFQNPCLGHTDTRYPPMTVPVKIYRIKMFFIDFKQNACNKMQFQSFLSSQKTFLCAECDFL